eukprot:3721191-Pleurochrysis_carterae.AAC.1
MSTTGCRSATPCRLPNPPSRAFAVSHRRKNNPGALPRRPTWSMCSSLNLRRVQRTQPGIGTSGRCCGCGMATIDEGQMSELSSPKPRES